MKANCVVCGKEFEGRNSRQKTCGPACRDQHHRENMRKYMATPKGREVNRKYKTGPKAQEARQQYQASSQYLEYMRQYRTTLKWQEYVRQYQATPEYREYRRQYQATPERREYQRKFNHFQSAAKALGIPPLLYAALKIKDHFSQQDA